MNKNIYTTTVVGAALVLGVLAACAKVETGKDVSSRNAITSVTTNENGSIARTFTEMTVTTNGNMVTEHRRETRTTLDGAGNMLETTTSEYAQSFPVGDKGMASLSSGAQAGKAGKVEAQPAVAADSFMGLKFGAVFTGTNYVADAEEPTLLRTTFKPKKPLAGFNDYYVYVTPKTHRIVKVYACAKDAVEPGPNWSRHYLIEALEKKYHAWARPRSWCRPIFTFDIGGGRFVTACLEDASRDYETVLVGWDDAMLTVAADETEALREAARKSAVEKRSRRISDAAESF